jgi:hypothetical protein
VKFLHFNIRRLVNINIFFDFCVFKRLRASAHFDVNSFFLNFKSTLCSNIHFYLSSKGLTLFFSYPCIKIRSIGFFLLLLHLSFRGFLKTSKSVRKMKLIVVFLLLVFLLRHCYSHLNTVQLLLSEIEPSVISRFRRDADQICALLRYYAASSGNRLPTFRDKVSVLSSRARKTSWPLKMEQILCPETSVNDYHSTLRYIPEERRSQNTALSITQNSYSVWKILSDWARLTVHLTMLLKLHSFYSIISKA